MSLTLGPTDEDAFRQSYEHGYEWARHVQLKHVIPDDVDPQDVRSEGPPDVHDFERVHVAISESSANRELWRALDTFYSKHKSAEAQKNFEREAAVAEDFDTAFNAGAYAGLLGEPCTPASDLPFLLGDD